MLLGSCVLSKGLGCGASPSLKCYTGVLRLSSRCFGSLLGFRDKGGVSRCFRSGHLRVTGDVLLSSGGAMDMIARGLKCPGVQCFDHLFGEVAKITPGGCELSRG